MNKRLLMTAGLLGATVLLGGCVAVPYNGNQYYGGGYGGGYYDGGYYAPAPVYAAPAIGIGFGYYGGWGGRGWGGGWRGR